MNNFFGKNLKKLRKLNKLSQEDLAGSIGIARNTISAYENNLSEPDISTLIKLCEYFGCSIEKLLFDTEGLQGDRSFFNTEIKQEFEGSKKLLIKYLQNKRCDLVKLKYEVQSNIDYIDEMLDVLK